jgi:hypothetical protein
VDTPSYHLAKTSAQLTTEPSKKILYPTLPYIQMSITAPVIQIKPDNGMDLLHIQHCGYKTFFKKQQNEIK